MASSIKTDHPVALDSLDHLHPVGTLRDNHSNTVFIDRLLALMDPSNHLPALRHFNQRLPFTLIDIGCSGGGFVREIHERGIHAVGVEGSDRSKHLGRAEWKTIPDRLFTCDATKPFTILEDQSPLVFDVVTAWEFFEHIEKNDLQGVMDNINQFTRAGALLICSVSNFDAPHDGVDLHRTKESQRWWLDLFERNGFERDVTLELYFNDEWVRWGTFNFVLVKRALRPFPALYSGPGARGPGDHDALAAEVIEAAVTIARLVGTLLPAAQKGREQASRAACSDNLRRLVLGLHAYHDANGRLPSSLAAATEASGLPPSGVRDGYQFIGVHVEPNHTVLIAEPLPGVTGSQNALVEVALAKGTLVSDFYFFPTPGAARERQRMQALLNRTAAEAVSRLVGLLPAAEQADALTRIRAAWEPAGPRVDSVLGDSDAPDGGWCLASLRKANTTAFAFGPPREILRGFTVGAIAAMQLGALGEDWMRLPVVAMPSTPASPDLFSVESLAQLTVEYASDPTLQQALLQLLRPADDAVSLEHGRDDERRIGEFSDLVRKARYRTLPAAHADALLVIAGSLPR